MLEGKLTPPNLPRGIVPLLETPFLENGAIDYDSLHKLVEHSINGGANGLTAPLVASEVQALSISRTRAIGEKAVAGMPSGSRGAVHRRSDLPTMRRFVVRSRNSRRK